MKKFKQGLSILFGALLIGGVVSYLLPTSLTQETVVEAKSKELTKEEKFEKAEKEAQLFNPNYKLISYKKGKLEDSSHYLVKSYIVYEKDTKVMYQINYLSGKYSDSVNNLLVTPLLDTEGQPQIYTK